MRTVSYINVTIIITFPAEIDGGFMHSSATATSTPHQPRSQPAFETSTASYG